MVYDVDDMDHIDDIDYVYPDEEEDDDGKGWLFGDI
jgi:hypothetical protein